MDDFARMEFNVDFSDLPESEEEMKKGMAAAELDKAGTIEFLVHEKDESNIIHKMYGKKDSTSLTMTHREMSEAIFNTPLFKDGLSLEQKKITGKFLETLVPKNGKFFIRNELILTAKNLGLVLSNS